jgi:hypothetical protein
MAESGAQIEVEVVGLAGRLGEVALDLGRANAWGLLSEMHARFPLPCGVFWKLALENEPVTNKTAPITGESVVTCVKCILEEHERREVVEEVEGLLIAGGSVDKLPLESHLHWLTLQNLAFSNDFRPSMANLTLPSGLQNLTFGNSFNQSMDNAALPNGLQSLTFGFNFNQSMDNVTLPSGLKSLIFGRGFHQSLDNVTLPSGLQSLTFGSRFNQSMDNVTLPSGLQIIRAGVEA